MILVTGANGVVGRAVMTRLQQARLEVTGIVREPGRDLVRHAIACDLSNCASLADAVQIPPAVIIHLAAAVPHSPRYPDTDSSAALTRRIDACVHAAAAQWRSHVVYASTCGLYDRRSRSIKTEASDDLIRIESPYFAAKLDGERLFASLGSCTVLRLPAPIGPGVPDGLVVSRFIRQALTGGTLGVWGSGRRQQNFVDVDDLAAAMLASARVRWQGTINLAARQPITMLELAHGVVDIVGRGRVVLTGQADPRDGETAEYSIERATSVLGWAPEIPLASSIRSLAGHLSTQHSSVRP